MGTVRLVEELDRMRPERRRDRRAVGAQLQPQVRVVADKGVHQLEGGAFLVVLACDIGVEADLVKTAARDDRQDRREGHDDDPAEAFSRFQKGDCRGTPGHRSRLVCARPRIVRRSLIFGENAADRGLLTEVYPPELGASLIRIRAPSATTIAPASNAAAAVDSTARS